MKSPLECGSGFMTIGELDTANKFVIMIRKLPLSYDESSINILQDSFPAEDTVPKHGFHFHVTIPYAGSVIFSFVNNLLRYSAGVIWYCILKIR